MKKYTIFFVIVSTPFYALDTDGDRGGLKETISYLASTAYYPLCMNASGEICVLANSHLREISSLYAQPEALSTLISENENTSENVRRAGQVIQGILQRAVLASGVRVVLNGAPAAMAACFLPRTLGCLADWSLRECGTMGSPTAELLLELVIITRGLPATYSLVEMIYCGWRSFQVKRSLARTFSENNRYRPLN